MLKLKEIRIKKGLYQKDIANVLGVTEATASRYENEIRKLNQDQITTLALALDVTPGELLGFEDSYNNYTQYLNSFIDENAKFKKIEFIAETMSGDYCKLRIKDIERIQDNIVYMDANLSYWLKTGNFEAPAHVIKPESLSQLITILDNNRVSHTLNLYPAKRFIENYPTTDKWVKAIEEYDKLPMDFE